MAILTAASPAAAATAPLVDIRIPAKPLADALVEFGLQAGVSVGARDLGRCGPTSSAVAGRMSPAAALAKLLEGARCDFQAVDAKSFSVAPRRTPTPEAAPTPEVATELSPNVLLDVVVTTTRRPSLAGRTPASISTLSSQVLTSARVESLDDLAPEFAGVTVTNLGPGRNKVFVRGLSDGAFTGRTQSMVGLYLDDVPITYNAPDPDLRLVDVERVEVMRGPQGTLYGQGSMGGIVRIVTRRPEMDTVSMGAAAGGSLTDSGAPSYAFDAMINAPVKAGSLAVRGVAYVERFGGYVDDAQLGLKDVNSTRRVGGRIAASAMLSPDWEVTLGATRQVLHSADSQYEQGEVGALQRNTLVREPHDNDFTQLYATLEGGGDWGRLRLSAAYVAHAFDTRYDASQGPLALFGAPGKLAAFTQEDRVRLAVTEAVLSSQPGPRLQWLAGVFAAHTTENLEFDLDQIEVGGNSSLYRELRSDRLTEASVYGEATYSLTSKLTVTAGLRAFHASLTTASSRFQVGTVRDFSGTLKTNDVSPKLVLSWQASPTKLFYLQAAQGYRQGGFNTTGRVTQQFNASTTGNQPNRQYRPDKLWSYEAGAKVAFAHRKVELRAAAFYTDWRDIQSDQFLPSGLPYTANVGRGVNTGFEAEGALRVASGFTLRANFLANGPQLTERDATYPSRRNASLPAVPRYSAAFSADWRHEVRPGLQAVVYGRLAYVGGSILTFQEQASSVMGDYTTARLSAGLETGRWRLTAFVDNPANTRGDTFAFGDPFTQGRVAQSTPLRPRTVGLTLAFGL